MRLHPLVAALLASTSFACSPDYGTTSNGSVQGNALTTPSAIYKVTTGGSFLYKNDIYVVISNTAEGDLCFESSNKLLPGLHLYFENGTFTETRQVDPSQTNLSEGESTESKEAEAIFVLPSGEEVMARGGTVTIESYDEEAPGEAYGEYDLTFENGERLSGTFHASFCSSMDSAADGWSCATAGGGASGTLLILALALAATRKRKALAV